MEGGAYMMVELFDINGHLTLEAIKAFKDEVLDNDEFSLVLEHISKCEKCAEIFADSFQDNKLVNAPVGFQEDIMSKVKKKEENNNQFLFYSFRVAVAACISLIIVFSSTLNIAANTKMGMCRIDPPDLSIVNSISMELSNFSQKIVSMEVLNNEKEKR